MEFTLDIELLRNVLAREAEAARAEVAVDIEQACDNSNRRLDVALASAADAHTLACSAGCSWCCYFSVDVRAVEVAVLLRYMEQQLSAAERTRIRVEAERNRQLLEQLSDSERVQRNIKCPFLVQGRCSVYAARPQTCRNYHATDAAGCRQSFEQPENVDIDPDFAPLTYQVGVAHVEAFYRELATQGYETQAFELNAALSAAMADPQAFALRLTAKLQAFPRLEGRDVEPEFNDL